MRSQVARVAVFVTYQLSLLVGIALFPLAVAARQLGVTIPAHRLIDRLNTAYERVA